MRNFRFNLSLAAGLILLGMSSGVFAAANESIAAIVNDSVITVSDIKDRADLYMSGQQNPSPQQRKMAERQVLDRLIDEALQMQEAKKLGITVSEDAVTAGFANIAKQNGLEPDAFRKRIAASGTPVDTLYAQIRADVAWSQVVRRKLRPEINVSDSEIDMTLDQIGRAGGKAQNLVAEIFLKIPDPAKDPDVRDEAQKLVKQLSEGASFVNVARQFSQAPGAAAGGDLGWVQEGQLDPALDKALLKMQPGQVSMPVRTDKGYHILLLRERRQGAGFSPETGGAGPIVTLKQIVIPVSPQDPPTVITAKTVRAQSLKEEVKSCEAMDAKMKDFQAPGTGDLGKGPLGALPKEMQGIVGALKVGELSAPIRTPGGLAVVMLCAREEEVAGDSLLPKPAAADDASRGKIADKIGLDRLNQMAVRYLRDLRATAFVDKRI